MGRRQPAAAASPGNPARRFLVDLLYFTRPMCGEQNPDGSLNSEQHPHRTQNTPMACILYHQALKPSEM